MRVVAGVAGGRRLKAPPGRRLRPTSERVREALFGSLGSLGAIEGARVLDLFAGTGALGIEALSRGAATATFVDDDPTALAAIRANLEATGLLGSATVVGGDVGRFLDTAGRAFDTAGTAFDIAGRAFDIVLADPPYDFDGWPDLMVRLPAPLAALESGRAIEPAPGWAILRSHRYGDSVVTLARKL